MTRITAHGLSFLGPDVSTTDVTPTGLSFLGPDVSDTAITDAGLSLLGDAEEDPTPSRPVELSPEEVIRIAQEDPERLQEAFAKMKERTDKPFAERVNEFVGPVGRGLTGGAQDIGNFVVGSVFRGLSYLPGMGELADKANHNQRLAAIQRAYDQYLNQTGNVAELITPAGAQFTSDASRTLSQMLLLNGAGKAAGIQGSRPMTAWMAANFGAMDAERSLQVATDAGLDGFSKNAYAFGRGGLSAGLTMAFGLAGEKIGASTAEEVLSRGASRAVSNFMQRHGLQRELVGLALEGAEEESIALTQALFGSAMGVDSFDEYKDNVGKAFLTGAAVRGTLGAGSRVVNHYSRVLDKVPAAVEGTLDAQDIKAGEKSLDDPDIQEKINTLDDYQQALEAELNELAELDNEIASQFEPIREQEAAQQSKFEELEQKESELVQLREDLLEDRNITSPERERLSNDLDIIEKIIGSEADILAKEEAATRKQRAKVAKDTAGARKVIDEELQRITAEKERVEREFNQLVEGRPDLAEIQLNRASRALERKVAEKELENVTAGKRERLNKDREALGLDKIPETERQPFLDALAQARDAGVPSRALELATNTLSSGQVWDDVTHVGVVEGLRQAKNKFDLNRKNLLEGNPDAPDTDSMLALDAELANQINTLTQALAKNSTTDARKLVYNRFQINNFDPGMALFRARRSKGSDLTSDEIAGVNEATEKARTLHDRLANMKPDDEGYQEVRREAFVAKAELDAAQQFDPAAAGLTQAARQGNFLWHTVLTGADASFAGIHSAIPLLLDPISTSKAIFKGTRKSFSEQDALDSYLDLLDRPNGDLYKKGVVTIHGPDAQTFAAEDLASQGFFRSWGRFDSLRHFVNFWPRVFRTVVNEVRADTFDSIVATAGGRGQFTAKELEDIGGFVDVITKRGGRGYLDKYANSMNLILFAPRYYAADVELLTGRPLRLADPKARKVILNQYGRLVSRFAAMYGAAMVANMFAQASGEEDVAEINLDPTHNRFMQIRFGDVWVDPTFRLARWLAYAAQAGTSASSIATGQEGEGLEEGRKFGRNLGGKLSLPLSTALAVGTKRDIFGREVTRGEFLQSRFTPISTQQMADSVQAFGVPKGTALGLVQATGAPIVREFKKPQSFLGAGGFTSSGGFTP